MDGSVLEKGPLQQGSVRRVEGGGRGRGVFEAKGTAEVKAESEGEVEELSGPWLDCEEQSAGDEAEELRKVVIAAPGQC